MRRLGVTLSVLLSLYLPCSALGEEANSPPAGEPAAHEAEPQNAATAEQTTAAEPQTAEKTEAASTEDKLADKEAATDGEPIVRPLPDEREKELIATIKMLFAAQDAVAAGHDGAKSLQGQLLAFIASKNYGAQRMTGSGYLANYLAGYLLSGGDPRLVEALVTSSQFDEPQATLLKGCISYRRGKRDEALKDLETVDLTTLSSAVIGRVALARAVITTDQIARERLLSIAIASMPGTLVEEGALRRSALGFSEAGDRGNFWKRVDRYTRRFPQSGYLPDFIQQVASATARMTQNDKHIDELQLDASLSRISQSQREKVFITLARLGSSRHMVNLISYAAGRLSRIAVPGSQEENVALLYHNAYRPLDSERDELRQELKSINPAALPEQERKLLEAALAVSEEIDAPLDAGVATGSAAATPLTNRAEAVLQKADKLLQESM